jgi:hypothetical protein
MDTYQDNWPKGLELKIPEWQPQRDWLKDQLVEIQEDQAIYSQLKDYLSGKDVDTDILLEEIQALQLDIIQIIGKELTI